MTARDNFGYRFIYGDRKITLKPRPSVNPIIDFYFSENDGWTYLNSGAERELCVTVHKKVKPGELERILKNNEIDSQAKEILEKMIKTRRIKSGNYKV